MINSKQVPCSARRNLRRSGQSWAIVINFDLDPVGVKDAAPPMISGKSGDLSVYLMRVELIWEANELVGAIIVSSILASLVTTLTNLNDRLLLGINSLAGRSWL